MNLLGFCKAHNGHFVTAVAGIGKQCVDLANLYLLEVRGQPHVFANAVDWQMARIIGFKFEPNGPLNSPDAGALVIWGPFSPHDIGTVGHIAVCVAANSMVLLTFDQDWPLGAPCSLTLHDYGGVVGWLNPTP